MELTIRDNNQQSAKPYTVKQPISLLYSANIIAFSDIELLKEYRPSETVGKLNKNGFDLIPLVDNFFSKSDSSLKFYCEYYHTAAILDKEPFLLSWQILQYESKSVMEGLSGFARPTGFHCSFLSRKEQVEWKTELNFRTWFLDACTSNQSPPRKSNSCNELIYAPPWENLYTAIYNIEATLRGLFDLI